MKMQGNISCTDTIFFYPEKDPCFNRLVCNLMHSFCNLVKFLGEHFYHSPCLSVSLLIYLSPLAVSELILMDFDKLALWAWSKTDQVVVR